MGWSRLMARRCTAGSRLGPLGTAQLFIKNRARGAIEVQVAGGVRLDDEAQRALSGGNGGKVSGRLRRAGEVTLAPVLRQRCRAIARHGPLGGAA